MLGDMSTAHGHAPEPKARRVTRSSRELREEALALPEDERTELACSLLQSIEDDEDGRSPNRESWETAWAAQVELRLAAMDHGAPGVPAAQALDALRQRR